jgi:hypothetical protein
MEHVFQDNLGWFEKDKWFFWDETGDENGPFDSELIAQASFDAYVKYEVNGEREPIRKMKDTMGL